MSSTDAVAEAETTAEKIEAAEQEIMEKVEQSRDEVKEAEQKIEEKEVTSYYIQPNSDRELEEFMKNYGLDDDFDYSKYLDEEDGGAKE